MGDACRRGLGRRARPGGRTGRFPAVESSRSGLQARFVATVVGSAVFVLAWPWAAASHNVKKTADTLVVKPANATFSRPLGDMTALRDE